MGSFYICNVIYLYCRVGDNMFKNSKKNSDKIDYSGLNEVIYTGKKILKIILILSVFSLVLLFTYILKEWKILDILKTILKIISPFFIGIVIAWLFDPVVTYLQKKGIKRGVGTSLVFVLLIGLLTLFGFLMFPALTRQINEIIVTMPATFNNITAWVDDLFVKLTNIYNYDFSNVQAQIYEAVYDLFLSLTIDLPTKLLGVAKSILSGGLNFIFGLFIGFYMLLDFNNVRRHLLAFVPKRIHGDVITLTDELNNTLKSYVAGTLLIMLLLFFCQSIGFRIAGLKAPMVFGLFCAVTNVIPYIGPYIGGIPAIIVGFTMSPAIGIFSFVSVMICQTLESYFLNPVVMSKTMKLHPVTIMLGLLIFGHFFGILGMILATPIIACGKVIWNFFNQKFEILDKINN